jgi:hypothetical protein
MNTAWLDILFLIIAAAVGYGVGLLDKRVTTSRRQKKEEKEEVLLAQKTAEELEKARTVIETLQNTLKERDQSIAELQAASKKESDRPPTNEQTALRVLAMPSGQWGIEIDGQPVPIETLTTEQRQRLVAIIVKIRPWIDGKKISDSPVPAPQNTAPAQTAPPPPPVLASAPAPTTPPQQPRINPLRGLRSMISNEIKKDIVAAPQSIIALIDEILQQKLYSSPLAAKSISLEEGGLGEVLIHVGAVRYSGLDSVPDPEIRAIIQEAIDEFNRTR